MAEARSHPYTYKTYTSCEESKRSQAAAGGRCLPSACAKENTHHESPEVK